MAKEAGLSERHLGRGNCFSPSVKIALMVLKAYIDFPDRQLAVHLHGHIHCQIFCGVMTDPSCPVTDHKTVSAIRNETASRLDIGLLQKVPPSHWKPYLGNLHVCMADATCHESHMRFPTDMRLIRESVGWLYRHTCQHYRNLGIRCPHNKYTDVSGSCLSCYKKRKRKVSRTRMLKHRMPKFLEKLVMQRDGIHGEYGASPRYAPDYQKWLSIIRKILVQGKGLFAMRKVIGRIVGIDRHYVRPVVRGKETKPVESGAKVDNMQADGISFIGHVPFKASNEDVRLKECIHMRQKLMNERVRCVVADSVYADNADRKSCTKYGISASFVRKGKAAGDGQSGKVSGSELSKEKEPPGLEAALTPKSDITRSQEQRRGTGGRKSCGLSSGYMRQMPYR